MSNISSCFATPLRAEAQILRHRIVKFGSTDSLCVTATAATDASIGLSSDIDVEAGEPCDVILSGFAPVTYGANVTRGALLTSDAAGRAVVAAPGAGLTADIIGRAMVAGVLGDIGSVNLSPSRLRG